MKTSRTTRILLIGLSIVAVFVTAASILYAALFNRSRERETDSYLDELSQHVAALVDYKIGSIYDNLEMMSKACTVLGSDADGREQLDALLLRFQQQFGFMRVSIVFPDYRAIAGDDIDRQLDPQAFSFLEAVFAGGRASSGLAKRPAFADPEEKQDVVFYGVPLINTAGEVVGAVMGGNRKEHLESLLLMESFGGQGYSVIVERNGKVVLDAPNPNNVYKENFFDIIDPAKTDDSGIERVRQAFQKGEAGNITFTCIDGEKRIAAYRALVNEQWYLLSLVPYSVVGENTVLFKVMAVAVNIVIALLLAGLLVLVLYMQRSGRRELERMAYVDPVTEGRSPARFEAEADALVRKAAPGTYAAVVADIRDFKLVNDCYGVTAGDRVLRYIYGRFEHDLGPGELVTRSGGDKFLLLVKNADQQTLISRFERMADNANSFNVSLKDKYYLLFSFGVYPIDEKVGLVLARDRANLARKGARPTSSQLVTAGFYGDTDQVRLIREKLFSNRQSEALASGAFVAYFQPKIDLSNGRVCGAEALVRWRDAERGLIPPAEFIPLFENNGFIRKVDLCVFEQVLAYQQSVVESGQTPMPVSVNLSRLHLYDPHFLRPFLAVLSGYDVPAGSVEFELTESLAFENLDRLVAVIDELHAAGFAVSLDDFGSGYSSLNILKELKVDTLKLDRTFFTHTEQSRGRGEKVVSSVIRLAKELGICVVAEGVETLEKVAFLKKAGCDSVQGYVYSPPLPPEDFKRYVSQKNQ